MKRLLIPILLIPMVMLAQIGTKPRLISPRTDSLQFMTPGSGNPGTPLTGAEGKALILDANGKAIPTTLNLIGGAGLQIVADTTALKALSDTTTIVYLDALGSSGVGGGIFSAEMDSTYPEGVYAFGVTNAGKQRVRTEYLEKPNTINALWAGTIEAAFSASKFGDVVVAYPGMPLSATFPPAGVLKVTYDTASFGLRTTMDGVESYSPTRPVMFPISATVNPARAPSALTDYHGVDALLTTAGDSTNGNLRLYTIEGNAQHTRPSTISEATGVYGLSQNTGAGTINQAQGIRAAVQNTGSGTINSIYGIRINTPTNTGGGTIGLDYGLYIDAQTAGSVNNFGIYSGGGTNWFEGITVNGSTAYFYSNGQAINKAGSGYVNLFSRDTTESDVRFAFGDIKSIAGSELTMAGKLGVAGYSPIDSALSVNGGGKITRSLNVGSVNGVGLTANNGIAIVRGVSGGSNYIDIDSIYFRSSAAGAGYAAFYGNVFIQGSLSISDWNFLNSGGGLLNYLGTSGGQAKFSTLSAADFNQESDLNSIDTAKFTTNSHMESFVDSSINAHAVNPDTSDDFVIGTGDTLRIRYKVPAGGTSNQVLKKNSNTSGDYSWRDDSTAAGGSGTDSALVAGYGLTRTTATNVITVKVDTTTDNPPVTRAYGIANYQPLDADLTYLAGFTPAANVKSILNAADYAAIKTLLALENVTNESKATMFTNSAFTGVTTAAVLALGTSPADAGHLRFPNAGTMEFEAAPAGTNGIISFNSSEIFTFSHAVTITGNIAADNVFTTAGVAANRIPYYTSTSAVGAEAGFEYDAGTNILTTPNATVSTLLTVPNGADPTTSAAGNIAIDTDDDAIEFYGSAGGRIAPARQLANYVILFPDSVQPRTDDVQLAHFPAEVYPFGITIFYVAISASASCTDTHVLEEWSDAVGTSQGTVESIALSGASKAESTTIDDGAIAADAYLNINLDGTTDNLNQITVTIGYYVNPGN